jgi:hypothetical protein
VELCKRYEEPAVGGLNAFISNFKGALALQVDEQVASKLLLPSDIDTFIDKELLNPARVIFEKNIRNSRASAILA